jgi:hypothetical protein
VKILTSPMALPQDLEALASALASQRSSFLFLDPFNHYFGEGFSATKGADVVKVCNMVAVMSGEVRVTTVGALHTNRTGGLTGRDKLAHSIEFRRACRSMMIIGKTRGDDAADRTLVHDKANYSELEPALQANITGTQVEVDGKRIETAALTFGKTTDATTQDLFLAEADRDGAVVRARAEAGAASTAAKEIVSAWEKAGKPARMPASAFDRIRESYGNSALRRGRLAVGAESEKDTDPDSGLVNQWVWHFPNT